MTPLPAILVLTVLASVGTGVFWNGIPFIAKHDYGFGQHRTLVLYLVIGAMYMGGAFAAGTVSRRALRRFGERGVLAAILATQAVVCFGPLAVRAEWMLWTVVCVTSLLSALQWPLVESYLTAGRHGRSMRSAIGWWNLSWTTGVGASLLFMAPLMGDGGSASTARLAIVGLGPLNAVAMVSLRWFSRSPAAHDEKASAASVSPEYPHLLRSARVLLPVSYLLVGAMSPLMPYLLGALEVPPVAETPVTSTWMFVRVAAIAIMWRIGFWHGRWGTLLLGGLLLAGGFAGLVAAHNVTVMVLGLAAFGVGQGIVYYAALYYAMSVGRAAVEAGGTHEALIGSGYIAGPFVTIVGLSIARDASGEAASIITVVWLAMALATVPALMPYLRARAARR